MMIGRPAEPPVAATGSDAARHARRYGWAHRRKRSAELADQHGRPCYRCGRPMARWQRLHLDHLDGGGPNDYAGWSHRRCNESAGARLARRPSPTPRSTRSRDW